MNKLMEYLTSLLVITGFGFFALSTNKVFADDITVEQGYVRATIPGTSISSAYMTIINNTDKNLTLLGASSAVSQRIEIHQHTMTDGMMKMRQVKSISVEAGSQLILEPLGYHLMIFNLEEPLNAGQKSTLTLHFAEEKNIEITLPIESIKRKKSMHHH
jgi:hypothetical protein